MAIITKISAQRRPGRYNLFLDGKYAFSASEKTVAEFVLLKGKVLTAAEVEKIKQFDQDAKASDLAAHYLSYEPRTVYEILQYLQKHGITNEAANSAVSELTELGYLDDKKYAALFIKNNLRVGKDGAKALARKLKLKGITEEIVQSELEKVTEDDWLVVAKKVIKSLQHQVGKISEQELKRKAKRKLLSHGFTSALANSAVEQLNLAPNEEEQIAALKKQGIKAYKRFHRYDEQKRHFKIKQYLFAHGFSSTEIDAFLNGEIMDLNELSEY